MQKTEKPVIIPLSEEAKRWLPKPRGNEIPFFDIPTTQTVIGRALRKWAEAAGIEKHVSFHAARHITFSYPLKTRYLQKLPA
jgi:integrase/recombinase XerD